MVSNGSLSGPPRTAEGEPPRAREKSARVGMHAESSPPAPCALPAPHSPTLPLTDSILPTPPLSPNSGAILHTPRSPPMRRAKGALECAVERAQGRALCGPACSTPVCPPGCCRCPRTIHLSDMYAILIERRTPTTNTATALIAAVVATAHAAAALSGLSRQRRRTCRCQCRCRCMCRRMW